MTEHDVQKRMDGQDESFVTLRQHIEDKLKDLWKYVDNKVEAQEKSVDIAHKAMNARLEMMNQFREDMRHQASTFVTRKEFLAVHKPVQKDIRFLRENRALLEGKASQLSVNITFILALISMGIAVVGLISDMMKT